jgi:hypothetical protein
MPRHYFPIIVEKPLPLETIVFAYRERVDFGCFECLVHFNIFNR